MFRPSPRFIATLLWLAIALLPLRSVAAAWMPVVMSDGSTVSVAISEAAPPCHGSMGDDSDGLSPPTCAMCDLCHTNALRAPDAPALAPAPHEGLPSTAAPSTIEPRAPDGLYRPPRNRLA